MEGGAGNDTLNGGAGFDEAGYSDSPAGVTVDLSGGAIGEGTAQDGFGGTDTLTGIEGVIGSAFNDTLTGDGGNNFLVGNAGNDTLIGGAGDDQLQGGAGNDSLDGGAGVFDQVNYVFATSEVTVDLSAGTAVNDGHGGNDTLTNIENVHGGVFDDNLTGDGNNNVLIGSDGSTNRSFA